MKLLSHVWLLRRYLIYLEGKVKYVYLVKGRVRASKLGKQCQLNSSKIYFKNNLDELKQYIHKHNTDFRYT